MDLSNAVCLVRPYSLDSVQLCLPTDAPIQATSLNTSLLIESVTSSLLDTCPFTQQLSICQAELSNGSLIYPFIHLSGKGSLGTRPLLSVNSIALRLGTQLFLSLIKLALSIPTRLFLWILSALLSQLQTTLIDLLVYRKLEAFLFTTFIILLVSWLRRRLNYWKARQIPFECFTAHLSLFTSLSTFLPFDDVSRSRRYGRLFGSFILTKPILCTSDCKLIEQILYTKADYFAQQNTWQIEGHLLGDSIFGHLTADIQRWKRKKAILLSSFLSRKIKLLAPTIDSLTEELLAYTQLQIERPHRRGKSSPSWKTNINSLIFPWLVYSLSALILDIDLPKYHLFLQEGTPGATLIDSCRAFLCASQRYRRSPLLSTFPFLGQLISLHLLNRANRGRIQAVLNDAIAYRLDNGLLGLPEAGSKRPSKKAHVTFRDQVYSSLIAAGKTDSGEGGTAEREPPPPQLKQLTFIDIILNYEIEPEDKLEGYDLSRQEVLDNLLAFFTVSLSTLSRTVSAALFYLALHQSEQTKVREEILDCIGSRPLISWESLRNLKYTEAFLKEVLRLGAPIERIERIVTKACTVESGQGELSLPRGLHCSILVSALHRDPEYYPEPETFKPSRFITKEGKTAPESPAITEKPSVDGCTFLAFGLGSRTCIGLKFVMFYLKHTVANLLLEYELTLPRQSLKHRLGKQSNIEHLINSEIVLTPFQRRQVKAN